MSPVRRTDLAEITHPDYPGERLVACRNPALAERTRPQTRRPARRHRDRCSHPIVAAVAAGRLTGRRPRSACKVGKVINKYKMAKHFDLDITDTTLTITRNTDAIDAEAALDGIYVIRTTVARRQPRRRRRGHRLQEPRPTSNATSAPSRSTTSTCARSTTASKTGSAPTS